MTSKYFFGLMLLAATLEAAGDIFFKKWALEHKLTMLAVGLVVYFFGTVFWAFSLKYEILSKAITIFTILNLIIIVLVGVLFFNERLTLGNKIGITLGVISILLIEL